MTNVWERLNASIEEHAGNVLESMESAVSFVNPSYDPAAILPPRLELKFTSQAAQEQVYILPSFLLPQATPSPLAHQDPVMRDSHTSEHFSLKSHQPDRNPLTSSSTITSHTPVPNAPPQAAILDRVRAEKLKEKEESIVSAFGELQYAGLGPPCPPCPPEGRVHVAARSHDWHGGLSGLGFYLVKHGVDFEVTLVDADDVWETVLKENEASGGGMRLPVVAMGRDVWWGETKVSWTPCVESCPLAPACAEYGVLDEHTAIRGQMFVTDFELRL